MMKYRENMTQEELEQFKKELQEFESVYASAAAHDAKAQAKNSIPNEWDDPSDYVGMGWIDSRGKP